jgi:hypothetical protein
MKWILKALLLKICDATQVGSYGGIKFSDWNGNPKDDSGFAARTTEALKLIQRLDPRRFARVERHLLCIQNTELPGAGRFLPFGLCQVDFGRYDFARYSDWCLYQYAGTIIHEATHGMLYAKGVRRKKSNWIQIERICRTEQNRFLVRINSPYGNRILRPFAPEDWNMGSLLTRLKTVRRRGKEEEDMAQQSDPCDVATRAAQEN